MQQNEAIEKFDTDLHSLIENYVEQQDFHVAETPLKSEQQIKDELKHKLLKEQNFKSLTKGIFNSINLINQHLRTLNDEKIEEKVTQELYNAFKTLGECKSKLESTNTDWINQWDLNDSIWTAIYGISDETLMLIYEIVLNCYSHKEINNAKDLLQLLLIFAPTVPAYWNALGFCLQEEGDLNQALQSYLFAEEIDEDIIETHFYLAHCYAAMKENSLAKEQVEKLYRLIDETKEQNRQIEAQVEQLAEEIL